MEISNEIKAKVFAGYFGQNVLKVSDDALVTQKIDGYFLSKIEYGNFPKALLLLKPLSAISDEDAIDIFGNAGIEYWPKEHTPAEYALICLDGKGAKFHPCVILEVWQELQNRGFDIPQHLLGGKTLKECDLCTYE